MRVTIILLVMLGLLLVMRRAIRFWRSLGNAPVTRAYDPIHNPGGWRTRSRPSNRDVKEWAKKRGLK